MAFQPGSLQQRFTLFMIIPVAVLLTIMGVTGFIYARDLLLDQWREAAILKLQRAAHEMDMQLLRIKDGIRLFHETSGAQYSEAFHAWALEHLKQQEGIVDVTLIRNTSEEGSGAVGETVQPAPPQGRGSQAMGQMWRLHRFHSANIREITPPRFDAKGQHGTVSLISDLLDQGNRRIGQLEVAANFDFLFKHVMASGWWQSSKAFLVDERGEIMVSTEPDRHGNLSAAQDALERETFQAMASAASGTLHGPGHPPEEISGFYRLQEAPWILVMIAPGREVLAPIIQFRLLYFLFGAGFILVIVALIRWVVVRTTTDIQKVSEAALGLSRGEFGSPLPVKSRDEVGELTRSFNIMMSQLRERLQLKEAMGLAMEVQQNLLPAAAPIIPGLDMAGRSLYCQETGGDYFDYIPRPSSAGAPRCCVAVGDVVGHGISAALLMTTVRAMLRCRLELPGGIAEAMGDVNRLLYRDTAPSGSFVTLFLVQVDPSSRSIEWVRAGHDPALLYEASQDRLQDLSGPGTALGVDDACCYLSGSRSGLNAGDILLIGTDGIWETRNARSEKFGKDRFDGIVRAHRRNSAEGILQAVFAALEEFRGQALQEDDITLVVIKVAG